MRHNPGPRPPACPESTATLFRVIPCRPQLVCAAGSLRALQLAVEADADAVRVHLNGLLIGACAPGESRGYPALCKGRFRVEGGHDHALEEPTRLNTLAVLPQLMEIGVAAIKIEGRPRSPACEKQETRVWRAAIDQRAACPGRSTQPSRGMRQPAPGRPAWSPGVVRRPSVCPPSEALAFALDPWLRPQPDAATSMPTACSSSAPW